MSVRASAAAYHGTALVIDEVIREWPTMTMEQRFENIEALDHAWSDRVMAICFLNLTDTESVRLLVEGDRELIKHRDFFVFLRRPCWPDEAAAFIQARQEGSSLIPT